MRHNFNCSSKNAKCNCKDTQIMMQREQKLLKTGKTCETARAGKI